MKKASQNLIRIQFIKESILLLTILFNFSVSFSQTNPWENKNKENPWEKTSEKEKSVPSQTPNKDSVNLSTITNSVNTENIDSINPKIPEKVIVIETKEENNSIYEKDSYYYLSEVKYRVKAEYKAPVAFVGSFLTSGVFLIFAVPVNLISMTIPNDRQKAYLSSYKSNHPNASSKEIKTVKNAITSKRVVNTLGGTVCGLIAGTIVWVTAILFN